MRLFIIILLSHIMIFPIFSKTNLDFQSVIFKTEQFPELQEKATKLAIERNLPISIIIDGKILIQPAIISDNKVVYSVITDFTHTWKNGYLFTFKEIEKNYNLNNADLKYYEEALFKRNTLHKKLAPGDSLYLIPESTGDQVMAFDAGTGDLIDIDFIPNQGTFSTPIEAEWHSLRNSLVVSDQLLDIVQEFDTAGVFVGTFVPKSGQAVDTLDNVRGIGFHPNGNLLVTSAGGANSDAVVEFDSNGNFVRNFVVPNASLMDSPFDVLTRSNDILVPGLTNEVVARYDFNGNFLDHFATYIDFPEQIVELANGEIAVANFGTVNSGVQIFSSTGGSYTQLLNGVTGVRGVAELANGNILTTNGGGVHELDRSTGALVRTIQSGVSARFISLYVVNQQQLFPIFNITPSSINFGTVIEDSSEVDTLIVYNNGTADLVFSSIISDDSNFVIFPDSGIISGSDSALFEVTFTASADSGLQNANIIFVHNAQSSPDTVEVIANVLTNLNVVEKSLPNSFMLFQNYPNPFNPITYFEFNIPVEEKVELKIFNIKGQEIETVISKQLAAGKYHYKYDANHLPSGVYIYSITAGSFSQSHKMILMK